MNSSSHKQRHSLYLQRAIQQPPLFLSNLWPRLSRSALEDIYARRNPSVCTVLYLSCSPGFLLMLPVLTLPQTEQRIWFHIMSFPSDFFLPFICSRCSQLWLIWTSLLQSRDFPMRDELKDNTLYMKMNFLGQSYELMYWNRQQEQERKFLNVCNSRSITSSLRTFFIVSLSF